MKCFIASAFDKKDVDEIYDRIIVPVLKKYLIQPLRVDRIEYNDDIDDKIFSLINDADFCIADLTYSRPSVYYEAGFVYGGGKSVIYIARKDHFKTELNDPYSIYKIHFDLQMKNIIPWTMPSTSFQRKLEKRISKVIKPLIEKRNEYNKNKAEVDEFAKLSQIRRQQTIIDSVKNLISLKKYSQPDSSLGITHPLKSFYCFSSNRSILFFAEPTVTKKMLNDFRYYLSFNQGQLRINRIKELHIFYLSLKTIPESRITEALPWFDKISERAYMTDWKGTKNSINLYIHFVDNIKSITELNNKMISEIDIYL